MRFARKAIEFEFKRQIDLIESGGKVLQQTLNFNPVTGSTSPLRDKEDAHDYRYFPEPDLPPIVLSDEYIATIKNKMAPLPWKLREQFESELGLNAYDANLLTEDKSVALFFWDFAKNAGDNKAAANLTINKILPYLSETKREIADFPVSTKQLSAFLQLIKEGKVSASIAYQRLFPSLIEQPLIAPLTLAQSLDLVQSTDADFLETLVAQAIEKHPDKVAAYRKGKKGLIGFFMGEVMRNSKGQAEPKATNALLRKMLKG